MTLAKGITKWRPYRYLTPVREDPSLFTCAFRWSFTAQFPTCWFKSSRPRPFFQLWFTGLFALLYCLCGASSTTAVGSIFGAFGMIRPGNRSRSFRVRGGCSIARPNTQSNLCFSTFLGPGGCWGGVHVRPCLGTKLCYYMQSLELITSLQIIFLVIFFLLWLAIS